MEKLYTAKKQLPNNHFYAQLMEAELHPEQSIKLLTDSIKLIQQDIRKNLIREKMKTVEHL